MKPLLHLLSSLAIATLLSFGLAKPAIAQTEDLTEYNDFFADKKVEYAYWLAQTKLSPNVGIEALVVKPEFIRLTLSAPGWDELAAKVKAEQHRELYELLFDRMLFTFNLRPQQAQLNINTQGSTILVGSDGEKFDVEIQKNMGSLEGEVLIKIGDLDFYNAATYNAKGSAKEIRKRLSSELEKYFNKYEAMFEDYGFDSYGVGSNSFVVEVKNVRNVVLDKDYFEFLRLSFTLNETNGHWQVVYSLDCKYGSGIIWAPRSSGYYDMLSKFPEPMKQFDSKLRGKINDLLTEGQ